MSYFSIDVEADGSIPGDYSMISIGAVKVETSLSTTFYAELAPISNLYNKEALAVSNFTREQTLEFEDPLIVMERMEKWLLSNSEGKPTMISDNNTFDGMFVFWYFNHFLGRNPFGFSARRIGDLYCGLVRDASKNSEWKKKYRITRHSHNALDDAKGNAEALLAMQKQGLRIKF